MFKYLITIYKNKGFEKIECEVRDSYTKAKELAEIIFNNENVKRITIQSIDISTMTQTRNNIFTFRRD